jgi:hypothetical protein
MSRIPFDRGVAMVWPWAARRLMREAGLLAGPPDYCFIFPRSLRSLRFLERRVARLPLGAQYLVIGSKPSASQAAASAWFAAPLA